jgi:FkbM family methyltransferase
MGIDKNKELIHLIDVGARFGIHPAFDKIMNACTTLLIDADPEECTRLQHRYLDHPNVKILNGFVGSTSQTNQDTENLYLYKHPGGNSKFKSNNKLPYWKNLRPDTNRIIGSVSVPLIDLDSCVKQNFGGCDILKIDCEGAELEVLDGAKETLQSAIGVRIEVMFNSLYNEVEETFTKVHHKLKEFDFFLLKYDLPKTNAYAPYSKFRGVDNFGVLVGGDALYIRNLDYLEKAPLEVRLKAAIFAATSNACDLSIHLLSTLSQDFGSVDRENSKLSQLWSVMERLIADYIFSNQDLAGQSLTEFAESWKNILGTKPLDYGDYWNRYR